MPYVGYVNVTAWDDAVNGIIEVNWMEEGGRKQLVFLNPDHEMFYLKGSCIVNSKL